MNIIIKVDETIDKDTLAGFALATGWRPELPTTKRLWMAQKLAEYVTQKSRQGFVMNATKNSHDNYITAVRASTASAVTVIPQPGSDVQNP